MLYTIANLTKFQFKLNVETRGGSYDPENEPKPGDSTSLNQIKPPVSELIQNLIRARSKVKKINLISETPKVEKLIGDDRFEDLIPRYQRDFIPKDELTNKVVNEIPNTPKNQFKKINKDKK
jgi:hypothetical protein